MKAPSKQGDVQEMLSRLLISRTRGLDEYPPLPTRGEDMRAVVRVEPCVPCGGRIVQLVGQPVAQIVQSHNLSAAHVAWRRTQERPEMAA